MLNDAKEGVFDVALVYKLDRIGRTLLNVVDAHDRLDACGVALRSATEPKDTSRPSGRLIFLSSFDEFERAEIRVANVVPALLFAPLIVAAASCCGSKVHRCW